MTEPVKRNEETDEPIKLRIDSLSIRIALALECARELRPDRRRPPQNVGY